MKDRITISDIAKLANVSKTTVSFYLNGHHYKMSEETKNRIREVIETTGFQPSTVARSLNAKQTYLLGALISDITSAFANQLIKGLTEYVQQRGYQLILGSSSFRNENERKCIEGMYNMGVDGFLVQPSPQFESMWDTMGIDKPLVFFDSPPRDTSVMYVKTDSYHAVYEAIRTTVKKGYTHFAVVTADPETVITRQERMGGFRDCLNAYGLDYDTIPAERDTSLAALREAIAPLIARYENLCVFAVNNWLLKKVFLALEDFRHLIPQKLGLLGMDAYEWNYLVVPPITTILQPAEEEGVAAGKLLIDAIERKNGEEHTCILKCKINEQASTARQ